MQPATLGLTRNRADVALGRGAAAARAQPSHSHPRHIRAAPTLLPPLPLALLHIAALLLALLLVPLSCRAALCSLLLVLLLALLLVLCSAVVAGACHRCRLCCRRRMALQLPCRGCLCCCFSGCCVWLRVLHLLRLLRRGLLPLRLPPAQQAVDQSGLQALCRQAQQLALSTQLSH